ncbi:Na-translocating system protein MpsC family protein [Aminiphilus sp.]|uniref:Na-translocating system protein MpsC family protein n=1 Tax=Aminiphilus sp. TaxID=1872488 RepID=UPI00261E7437|nr:Na-translocating system protein MpsC family protein [Aminiphilus sp.]
MQPGEFKQEIMRINNAVNQEMFGLGFRWQKVHVIDDKVLVLANNQRVKALATLSAKDRGATKLIDNALLDEYKSRIRSAVEKDLKIRVTAVLKDYDPDLELACMLIVFAEPVLDMIVSL